MGVKTETLRVATRGHTDIIDLTPQVREKVSGCGLANGVVTVFVSGSTAGVTTIEYESGAIEDLRKAIERAAPRDLPYDHDARWGDGNGYAHVRAALLGPSLTVPFNSGLLRLGAWQQIVLADFDNRPRTREVLLQIVGE